MEDTLQALIAFSTVTGDESVRPALEYISMRLKRSGMDIREYRSGGFSSIVATSQPKAKCCKVMLAAHLDVVPGPAQLFQLRKEDKRYTGRGVFDMKFAIACYIYAAEQLAEHMNEYDFGIMITTDEEVGGPNGVEYLLKRGYSSEICLLPDGAQGWNIETSAKGAWHVMVEASGTSTHGSRPWEGNNAIEKLMSFIGDARQYVPYQEDHTAPTMVVTTINGGEATNQVPNSARLTLDIRFRKNSFQNDLAQKFNELSKINDVTISTIMMASATQLQADLPLVKEWERVVKEVRDGAEIGYTLSYGSSDARYFSARDIPTIVTRPHGGMAHADGEWLDIVGFKDFCTCVEQYVISAGRVNSPRQLKD